VIKSPLNYVGGKYKLLPQILPLFPKEIDTFYDLFGGGFNVGINVDAKKHVYNDILKPVVELLWALKKEDRERVLMFIDDYIDQYNLSKTNKEGYLALRERYNETKRSPFMFYTLVAHSFNNQIRFNKKGEFNMPFGMNRSSFNSTLRKRFIAFVNKLQTLDVSFYSKDFREFKVDAFDKRDFIYCDPPYLLSLATYNENGGWTERDEKDLYNFLNEISSEVKWAMSNVLETKGERHSLLESWVRKNRYKIHYLNADYSNSNHQRKKHKPDVEILVTNY
jgi:DNA adenine methylase Dam